MERMEESVVLFALLVGVPVDRVFYHVENNARSVKVSEYEPMSESFKLRLEKDMAVDIDNYRKAEVSYVHFILGKITTILYWFYSIPKYIISYVFRTKRYYIF
jgi:hypothetical protein